jgi:biotin-dependent carboxylase-like uncharacterized protein
MTVEVLTVGPSVSLQDAGRPGGLGIGLSRGGAADRFGYLAGCALLGAPMGVAAVEMAGFGGTFRFTEDRWFALTGAGMRAALDGAPLGWNATYQARAGQVLAIGSVETGVYGYLSLAGGIAAPTELGGRGFHQIAGLGRALAAGDRLEPAAPDQPVPGALIFRGPDTRAAPLRILPGPQTAMFPADQIAAFEAAAFIRSARANRQGVRLDHDGAPFAAGLQLTRVSDFISEGDVQMTGDGTPYVLLADCQTMGGYPRIGTVVPADLPRIAQAMPGDVVRFQMITVEQAEQLWKSDAAVLADLKAQVAPRVRDPREIRDLLSYDLIDRPSSAVTGLDE